MSEILQFKGNIQITIAQNTCVGGNLTELWNDSLYNKIINWDHYEDVPNAMKNSTLYQLKTATYLGERLYEVTTSTTIHFTGIQLLNANSGSVDVEIENCNQRDTIGGLCLDRGQTYTFTYEKPYATFKYEKYDITQTFDQITDPNQVSMRAYNSSGIQREICQLNFTLTLNVIVKIECGGLKLDSPVCTNFCNLNNNNLRACFEPYLDYCFQTVVDNIVVIEDSPGCLNFFKNYYSQIGPKSESDAALTKYCSSKYKTFNELFTSGNNLDINLCGCHMNSVLYQNYSKEVENLFPGFGKYISNSGINDRCLLSQCASSDFKTVGIGKNNICNIPKCINVAEFNNNGTFDKSKVNINQSGTCESIKNSGQVPSGGPGNPKGSETTQIEDYLKKYWILLTIIILIIILFVVLIIIFK